MNIVISPDPMLRQVCEPCEPGDSSLIKLAHEMADTMYANDGCGLAAPQVGVLKRLVVIDCDPSRRAPIYLVNPKVVDTQGDIVTAGEGCLSIPGIQVPIARPEFARVEYFDLDGNAQSIEGDELLGRCLQHETDHLDGKTLFETCDPLVRIKALQAYREALAQGARPGETTYAV